MKALYKALLKVQSELKPVKRTSENPFFHSKYADLEAVVEAVVPILTQNGIIASQVTRIASTGLVELVTSLIHAESGDKIESISPIITKDATDPQKFIAATTYARRSSLTTICGLATQDDDGNAAAQASKQAPRAAVPASQPEKPATASLPPAESTPKATPEQMKGLGWDIEGTGGGNQSPDREAATKAHEAAATPPPAKPASPPKAEKPGKIVITHKIDKLSKGTSKSNKLFILFQFGEDRAYKYCRDAKEQVHIFDKAETLYVDQTMVRAELAEGNKPGVYFLNGISKVED